MSATSDGGEIAAEPPLDTALDLLADETRRLLLYALREHGEAPLDDVADVLAGWVALRRDGRSATPDTRRDIYTSLYHVHVPKLRAAGVVDFDEESSVLDLRPTSEEFDRLLDAAMAIDIGESDPDVPKLKS